jgi:hypothetical protein
MKTRVIKKITSKLNVREKYPNKILTSAINPSISIEIKKDNPVELSNIPLYLDVFFKTLSAINSFDAAPYSIP